MKVNERESNSECDKKGQSKKGRIKLKMMKLTDDLRVGKSEG